MTTNRPEADIGFSIDVFPLCCIVTNRLPVSRVGAMTVKKNITVERQGYSVDYPDQCPICHRHSEVKLIQTQKQPSNTGVQVIFQCAFSGCLSYFIGYYGPMPSGDLKVVKPQKPLSASFPEAIGQISPNFVSIYQEAEEAKHLGLNQIAGPGYRKAFEHLIKDYATSLDPSNTEKIQSAFSGNVVKNFVADPRISKVAERALWLGNDESHYLRKWENHNISDLITLIRLCINWIEIERLSNAYETEMPRNE